MAAPVSDTQVDRLLTRLDVPSGGTVVDLGCGSGAWMRRLVTSRPDVRATAVDLVPHEAHPPDPVDSLITWVTADVTTWEAAPVDRVLVVGVEHAFGGLAGALDAVRRYTGRGGRGLVGVSFWEAPPSERVSRDLGLGADDVPDLAAAAQAVTDAGFEIVDGHVSTAEEWDNYEWSWTGTLVEYGLSGEGSEEDRAQALSAARSHRSAWLEGYRSTLGFVTFVVVPNRSARSR